MTKKHDTTTPAATNACWIYTDTRAVREAVRLTKSLGFFRRTATVPMMTMDALEEFKMKINRRTFQIVVTPIEGSSLMYKVTIRKRNLIERICYKPDACEPMRLSYYVCSE